MRYIFDKDLSEKIEDISINGLENTIDIFWFCVKVLRYGIVNELGTANIESVSMHQFQYIQECMSRLGIFVHYEIVSSTEFDTPFLRDQISIHINSTGKRLGMTHFIENNQEDNLPAHKLFLFTPHSVYKIHFDFIRIDTM